MLSKIAIIVDSRRGKTNIKPSHVNKREYIYYGDFSGQCNIMWVSYKLSQLMRDKCVCSRSQEKVCLRILDTGSRY